MEFVKLNELCEINIGKTPSRNNQQYWGLGSQWISISDMKETYISKTKEQITDIGIKECNMKIVPQNTVIMSFKLTIGKLGITSEDMYTNEAIASFPIKDNSKLDTKYLYYCLQTLNLLSSTDRAVMGATLNKAKLNELKIPYVSLERQVKIANILDQAQELIDKRKAQIEALDELIQSVFYDMFGRIQDEDSNALKNYIDIIGGYAFSSKGYKVNGIPIVKIGTVNKGYFDENNMNFWDEIDDLEKYTLYPGDIVITLTGTVGKDDYANVLMLPFNYDKYYLNQRVANIKIKNKQELNNIYLLYAFKQREVKNSLTKNSRGIRQANIANQDIYELKIAIPPIERQNQFAEIVESIEKQKALLNKSLIELENNFNSLMQRAFNGELF